MEGCPGGPQLQPSTQSPAMPAGHPAHMDTFGPPRLSQEPHLGPVWSPFHGRALSLDTCVASFLGIGTATISLECQHSPAGKRLPVHPSVKQSSALLLAFPPQNYTLRPVWLPSATHHRHRRVPTERGWGSWWL